ncbi:hypothetical protein TrST_g7189 [Triparma strigata]|uniref:Uncharacterized protein n=1 Tax=Triparma strigata TaxID=1606541 RepID=A0A9W7ATJ2_9STRA|nr:hypothetical protein TrST_g7189 [Triparma strigata]
MAADTGAKSTTLSDKQLARDLDQAVKERSRSVGVGKLAGNTTLDDRGIYADLKRAVLNTPDSLARTQSTSSDSSASSSSPTPPVDPDSPQILPSAPQMITTPSPSHTPSDCIVAVLDALQSNDSPVKNHGLQVLFAFTSPASASVGSDVEDFASYIPQSKYAVLLNWDSKVFDKKIDYNPERTKAYINVKIRDKDSLKWSIVSWVLSSRERIGGSVWLIDSMLVRPSNKYEG